MPGNQYLSPKELVFKNAKGEAFRLAAFGALDSELPTAEEHSPSVLLCVHGAGMSSESFFRLATYIRQGQNGSVAASQKDAPAAAVLPPHAPAAPQAPSAGHGSRAPANEAQPGREGQPPRPAARLPPPTMHPKVADVAAITSLMSASSSDPADEVDVRVLTYDQRCHGNSTFGGGEDHLTLDVLVDDFAEIFNYAKARLFPRATFYVLGHSLGGAVVVNALSRQKELVKSVGGVILLDVVEGTSKWSLKYMHDFLLKRPSSFVHVKDAESWFLHHGGMRTPEAAARSVPPLLRQSSSTGRWEWKSNLSKMEAVWDTWFNGLDKAFVGLPVPKMLCLATADRLDTELTVAQMQGKFQFEIIGNECGHYIMDDATAALGSKILRFIKRIDVLTQKLQVSVRPGTSLHYNNTTIPPSRLQQ